MVQIIPHARKLKSDDESFKGSLRNHRTCTRCDLNVPEDIKQSLMSCPDSKEKLDRMYFNILMY